MANIEEKAAQAPEAGSTEQQMQIPGELPLLPLRDIVIYPFMIVPLFVSRDRSIRAVDEAYLRRADCHWSRRLGAPAGHEGGACPREPVAAAGRVLSVG